MAEPEPARACYAKKRYTTLDHAEMVAREVGARRRTPLRVYGCELCGGYHLSSSGARAVQPKPGWRPAARPWRERRPGRRRRR